MVAHVMWHAVRRRRRCAVRVCAPLRDASRWHRICDAVAQGCFHSVRRGSTFEQLVRSVARLVFARRKAEWESAMFMSKETAPSSKHSHVFTYPQTYIVAACVRKEPYTGDTSAVHRATRA